MWRPLVNLSLLLTFLAPMETHFVCEAAYPTRGTGCLILSMWRWSCVAKQQFENPADYSCLTSDRATIALAIGTLETIGLGSSSSGKAIWELRPVRHPVMSHILLQPAPSVAVPLEAMNFFAMLTKGRGKSRPWLWNFCPLNRSGEIPLLKLTCSFQIQDCKHMPVGSLPHEGGLLSLHPVNSSSHLQEKRFLEVFSQRLLPLSLGLR